MSKANDLLRAGELRAAIDEVTREVKANPMNAGARTFLFELLSFAGEFDRAEKQLEAIGHSDVKTELGTMVYRNNLKSERERRKLFQEGVNPSFLTEPPEYIDWHIAAINYWRIGKLEEARELLDRAEEARPAFKGNADGRDFADFRDYDDFVAPVFELIVKDQYVWLPIEQVRSIEITKPKHLRDLLWTAVRVESLDGTIGEVYIHSLYSGSSDHAEDQVKLGRKTDWQEVAGGFYRASGLRTYLVDDEDKPLFEFNLIEFDHPDSETPNGESDNSPETSSTEPEAN
ncbi:MAG: type VI secretion system accessory protein TagJ [Acidobacteriota bacterium]